MSMLPRYIIIHEPSIMMLQDKVNEFIAIGYVPFGTIWLYPWGKETYRFAISMLLPINDVPQIKELEQ